MDEKEIDSLEELDEVFDIVIMKDDEGNDVEFTVIDGAVVDDVNYLLVIETEHLDDEQADADILKEIAEEGENLVFGFIQDEDEYERVAAVFQENDEDYELEI